MCSPAARSASAAWSIRSPPGRAARSGSRRRRAVMRRYQLVAAAALLSSLLSARAWSDDFMSPIGGGSGGQFVGACKAGEVLTGFQLRIIDGPHGSLPNGTSLIGLTGYLDALRPVCARAISAQRVAAPVLVNSWGRIAATDAAQWQSLGFAGGAATVTNDAQLVNR